MAKITMVDGSVIEGSVEELKLMADLFGVKKAEGEDGYRKVVDRSARVGDFIKYDEKPTDWAEIKLGQYYEIKRIDSFDDPQIVDDEGDEYDTSGDTFGIYEKVRDEPCCEELPKEETLKVGDYAKVIRVDKFELNDIVKITGEDSQHFIASRVPDEYWHYADKEGELVKATDEEVSLAKARAEKLAKEQAELARWSAIGRKLNEFKKGDIVRTIRVEDGVTGGHKEGTIGEVLHDTIPKSVGNGNPFVNANGERWINNCELITPVEQRFDR